jgi:hypothetical protein
MSEVFRFVAERPVQRAAPKDVESKTIKAYEEPQRSSFHQQLRAEYEQKDRAGMVTLADNFVKSSADFVKALSTLGTPLAVLDAWLLDGADRIPPVQVGEKIKTLTGKTPGQLVVTEAYKKDRRRVSDSLLALAVAPPATVSRMVSLRAELLRGMTLFGLLERLARPAQPSGRADNKDDHGGSSGGFDADDVYRLLARGVVLLPADVFPLPAEPPAPEPPTIGSRAEAGSEPDRNPQVREDGSPEHRLQVVLGAMEELQAAFEAHSPVVPPAGELGGNASSWALPEDAVGRLSATAREAAVEVAGPAAFANVPETITRLEGRAATLGAEVFADGATTAVVPLGGGFVDLSALTDGHVSLNGRQELVPAAALVRTPGVADLMMVRQKIKRYEMGEVAHVENVLQGEIKERVHRRKTATETTVIVETERTEESEQDLQTTTRFELQREATKTAHEDAHLQGGVTITASYGPTVSLTTNAGFALNHSKDESNREASNYARDVTERSVSRIQERVREERTIRTISEVEETNKHGIDNADGGGHVVGNYRWVDKVYEAQIFNYGKRLLLEFNVPEPAAFFLHALAAWSPEGLTVDKPLPPVIYDDPNDPKKPRFLSPADIAPSNYLGWVHKYQVAGLNPPPKPYEVSTLAWEEQDVSGHEKNKVIYKASKEIEVPDGYAATKAVGTIFASAWKSDTFLAIGDVRVTGVQGGPGNASMPFAVNMVLNNKKGKLPLALHINDVWGYSMAIEVLCERTEEALAKWQLQTYEAILRAYFELKAQYDEQVAASATRRGIDIAGRNPLQNRSIEKAQLKKATITMLSGKRLEGFDAIDEDPESNDPVKRYPEIDIQEAQEEGKTVQFFEQAFEWPQMTYTFYPYFWSRKDRWVAASQLNDPADPLFAAFLQAGAARVVVPVRPGFEAVVNAYLGTGEIWGGGPVPQVGDPLYVAISQEIQEQLDAESGGIPQSEPWEVRVPTTLTILQQDAELPVFES